MSANGNSPSWVRSSARIATAIVHNVRKFSWQQKKDLNATARMHAHFCKALRRIDNRVVKRPFARFLPYQMTGRSSSGLYSLSPGLISGKAR